MTAKTVKVRIAVAVGADGTWNAAGWSGGHRADGFAAEPHGGNAHRVFWLTAELPIPEIETVEAEVEAGE